MKILANSGEIHDYVDVMLLKQFCSTNSRKLEDLGRLKGTSGKNNFVSCAGLFQDTFEAVLNPNSIGRIAFVEQSLLDVRVGQNVKILSKLNGLIVG